MTDPAPRNLGERIRYYRKLRNIPQRELAALIGRSHSMISGVENGTRKLHADELIIFARALNVPVGTLVGETEKIEEAEDRYRQGFLDGWQACLTGVLRVINNLRRPDDDWPT